MSNATAPAQDGACTSPLPTAGSLAERLSSRENSLNFIRLVLACLVIFGHTFPLGGFPEFTAGPFVHGGFHGLAVFGFFAISGYLILAAALRTNLRAFLWRRLLRIYPGYLVAILLTAFLFPAIGHAINSGVTFDPLYSLRYVLSSLDLKVGTLKVSENPTLVPWNDAWNGSLWTLFYEGLAYLATGVLVALIPSRRVLRAVVAALIVVFSVLFVADGLAQALLAPLPQALDNVITAGLPLGAFFTWGMGMYFVAERITPRRAMAIMAVLFGLLLYSLPAVPEELRRAVALPAFTYGVLVLGATLRISLGSRNDLSYGVYVYAFPVQQVLILLGIAQYGWFITSMLCLLCTLPFAVASWKFIEEPALRLKRLVPAHRTR